MTTLIESDVLNRIRVEREELPDGSSVWVAADLELDGCIAQADTREEAIAALGDARRDYLAVQRSLAPQTPAHGTIAISAADATQFNSFTFV